MKNNNTNERLRLEMGLVGKIFGSGANAGPNIVAFVIMTIFVSGLVLPLISSRIDPNEYWRVFVPIISGAVGYLFGKDSR